MVKLLNPFFQTKYRYLVSEGSVELGEVFVLDPKHIAVSKHHKVLKCVRK